KYTALRSAVVFGGVDMNPQTEQLRRGVEILVATPGRLLDHVQQRSVNLSQVRMLVLDEADRMLDMGFEEPIREIAGRTHRDRQSLLFSATFPDNIRAMARD
ncbi:DEAD/DEAH box helicase, partial [Mycobacterium tuberculosis]|nr:DEAD/DEAH box helicase [Mycobacterium tuberculosis]